MNKYIQEDMLIDTELDEIGRRKSLNRYKNESQLNFKNRIHLCAINTPTPTLDYYTFATNNQLNLFERKIFRIGLVDEKLDPNDLPKIEIEGNKIEVWKNQSKPSVLRIHFDNSKYKFLINIKEALEKLDFINVELLEYSPYLESKNLKQKNSNGIKAEILLQKSRMQNLGVKYIESYTSNNPIVSYIEKDSIESIQEDGEFFLDKINGFLYTNFENKGFGTVTYQKFPFDIEWSPVKIIEMSDESAESLFYEKQINEEGESYFGKLNSYGAQNINEILKDNRLYWDK